MRLLLFPSLFPPPQNRIHSELPTWFSALGHEIFLGGVSKSGHLPHRGVDCHSENVFLISCRINAMAGTGVFCHPNVGPRTLRRVRGEMLISCLAVYNLSSCTFALHTIVSFSLNISNQKGRVANLVPYLGAANPQGSSSCDGSAAKR